eukprot:CAMPEP_0185341172 /NCGR_PEP_ID=MMETSP1363-20130426/98492_1 /TAXON_ID=38817 /ORGANISM="Gephyrocapsa oceanica, Strain RCC1303" /LENGTH=156 /DNA_ID=CAMNT_0027940399 /DNA_START=174 /DNA_END=645 /DNA_ORIENTATION=-
MSTTLCAEPALWSRLHGARLDPGLQPHGSPAGRSRPGCSAAPSPSVLPPVDSSRLRDARSSPPTSSLRDVGRCGSWHHVQHPSGPSSSPPSSSKRRSSGSSLLRGLQLMREAGRVRKTLVINNFPVLCDFSFYILSVIVAPCPASLRPVLFAAIVF